MPLSSVLLSVIRVTSTTASARAAAAADLAPLVLQSDRRELAFLGVAHRRVARLVLLGVLATRLSDERRRESAMGDVAKHRRRLSNLTFSCERDDFELLVF